MSKYHAWTFFVSMTQVKNVLMNFYSEKREKNAEKHVFCQFWPLYGVKIYQKHRFWTRSVQLPLFTHLSRLSTFWGAKRWPRASEPDFVGKSGPYTFWSVRPSLGVESRVRCWFLCLDTLQVQRLCIQVISTPSSGQKMRKTCIFEPICFPPPRYLGN